MITGETPYNVKVGARALVIRQTEAGAYEVLIGQRPMSSKLDAGKWSLPGGKPLYEEEIIDCVARELQEETGLVAQEAQLLHIESGWYEGSLVISFFIYITQWSGHVISHEGQEQWQWCPLDALPNNFMANTQKLFDSGLLNYILQDDDLADHDDDCGDCA